MTPTVTPLPSTQPSVAPSAVPSHVATQAPTPTTATPTPTQAPTSSPVATTLPIPTPVATGGLSTVSDCKVIDNGCKIVDPNGAAYLLCKDGTCTAITKAQFAAYWKPGSTVQIVATGGSYDDSGVLHPHTITVTPTFSP